MSAAIAVATGRPARLDPYENNCTSAHQHTAITTAIKADDDYAPGRFRRRYERAATNGAWGHEWGTCGRMTLARRESGIVTIRPVLCDCWACQLCGVRRAAWLKEQIGRARGLYGLDQFWTLTVWTKTCTAPQSFAHVKRSWHWLSKDLSRAHGRFSYVWTTEATKRGFAHLHLLTSLELPPSELSARWRTASRGSFVVDAQPAASERAATYLAKYCVEQATLRCQPGWEHLKGTRVFSKSRDVQFVPFRSPGGDGWEPIPVPYWNVVARLRQEAPVLAESAQGIPCLQVELPASGGRVWTGRT